LAPIGCIGEVVIQGPTLLREYLSNPKATEAAILTTLPEWAPHRTSPRWNRFYKTGDLCFYNPDGTIEFSSRKDTQVKIRGLRVELSEVEHHIQASFPGIKQVAVDVLKTENSIDLVSYLCFNDESQNEDSKGTKFNSNSEGMFLPLSPESESQITAIIGYLNVTLPRYMIPAIFIPCRYMPLINSAKLDRNKIRKSTATLTKKELERYALLSTNKRSPATAMEFRVQKLWGEILNIPQDSIGRDDSFLRIGGDSISAIRLVGLARDSGIVITVKDIFDDPRLSAVASAAFPAEGEPIIQTEPFSLLPPGLDMNTTSSLGNQCKLPNGATIEDAYLCTKLQEGLMALAVKQPKSYIANYVFRIPTNIDIQRFKLAWERTVDICSNLRTRILLAGGSTIQVIIKDDIAWEETEDYDLESFMKATREIEMIHGSRLCRYALIKGIDSEYHFVWTIHHAVFDGWTTSIIMRILSQVYNNGDAPALPSYSGFIKHTMALEAESASRYWKEQLHEASRATFPPSSTNPVSSGNLLKKEILLPRLENSSITKATIIRAAWAIVLAHYCNTNDVCFGTTISGRHAAVPGIESMAGPAVATVPVRVRLDSKQNVFDFLADIQNQASNMVAYEQYGLQNIAKVSDDARDACEFSSLLVIQPLQEMYSADDLSHTVLDPVSGEQNTMQELMEGYFTYPLVVQGFIMDDRVDLHLIYDSALLTEAQLMGLCHHFEHVTQQLATKGDTSINSISLVSQWDVEQATGRNSHEPEIMDSCVHHLVEQQAKLQPDALAIDAWDRKFTYSQLDNAASRLACYLVRNFSIRLDELVHVCFEKSAWFFVAILAINKAGAAWVPLDPSHPIERQRNVIRQTAARIALVSPANAQMCAALLATVVEVTPQLDKELSKESVSDLNLPVNTISPRNATYVLFTSGSTGTPKGLVMEHGSVCTSQTAICQRLGLTKDVRILQFASFVFDLCIGEIIAPLISGACICVPSEHTRLNDLKGFIHEMNINWAFLTPSFAQTINPEEVPTLELLLLAGEAVSRDVLNIWFGKVRLINGWGPAETCVFSTLHEWTSANESPLTVGQPVGGSCWIVDPEDPQKLAPIGCIGEVVIQGPTLLREYLSNEKITQESTITMLPDWAPRRFSPYWNRFYKSGDLCFYNPDGTIEFSSRKDTQVKIRGLRVELSEVEYHVKASVPGIEHAAVDVLKTDSGLNLVSYICFSDNKDLSGENLCTNDVFLPLTVDLEDQITAMIGYLNVTLPRYMIPTLFIPCRYMPLINSAKLDRNKLRALTAALKRNELERYSLLDSQKRTPETDMESKMRNIWAQILKVPEESIGRDDSFVRIGGDSISAIRLVGLARDVGIQLTVRDIFNDPRLFIVSSAAVYIDNEIQSYTEPFSLLPPGIAIETIKSDIRIQCELSTQDIIEDVYPCTQLQEGLMSLATKHPGSYVAKYMFQLPKKVDVGQFKLAWERTVDMCTNLRTRIVFVGGTSIQALIKGDISWETTNSHDIESFMSSMSETDMVYGSRLCRYALIEDGSGTYRFVWTIHHAVFDGWTTRIVLQTLDRAYRNLHIPTLQPYSTFIKYTSSLDHEEAKQYWKAQLSGSARSTFPTTINTHSSSNIRSQDCTRLFRQSITFPRLEGSSITTATILRAAWAIVLACYSDSDDICFGTSISGRHAPVIGIERIAGLAVATVPIRVRLDKQKSIANFLHDIQNQASDMVAYEQYGLQNISKVSNDAKNACDFSSLLVIQPVQQIYSTDDNSNAILNPVGWNQNSGKNWTLDYFTYPLVTQGLIMGETVDLHMTYDSRVLTEAQLIALCHQLDYVTQQLSTESEVLLCDVSLTSEWDMHQAVQYNEQEPQVVESCVHHLIEKQAMQRPDAIAIDAWDYRFTYSELEASANRLAHYLVAEFGVCTDDLIHVCFEKSAWFIVAILAINKAGAAWVPLDPSHPLDRHRQVVQQTAATLALASPANVELCATLVKRVIQVTPALDSELRNRSSPTSDPPICNVAPHNAAYVLFTSGSTGTPKGCVIEHRSVCSNQKAITHRLRLTPKVRLLQFSSYVFDFSIAEIIFTLISGACICVPSDHIRLNSLKEFISAMDINWLYLTPSVARTLQPDDLPNVELLLLGGEAVGRDVFDLWFGKVRLLNCWGPTETCVCSAIHEWTSSNESPLTIGKPVGSYCWIVDSNDPTKLAPIGCLGEIVIQGPTLLREYLSNLKATETATVTNLPQWTPQLSSSYCNRFYKTGDLCFYNPDGSIEFSSRKDTQIKVRGLRVELSEIEYHIKASLPGIQHVAVDVFKTDSSLSLVSYLCFNDDSQITKDNSIDISLEAIFLPLTEELERQIAITIGYLNLNLPQYMIPTVFIPCGYMPLSNSAKLDRKKLRTLTTMLSRQQLDRYSLLSTIKRAPETEMEFRMQKIWSQILNIQQESIGRDDSFLHIGGDSISAIRLVGIAREIGIVIAVKNILDDSRLSAVAAAATAINSDPIIDAEPFSLLPPSIDINSIPSYVNNQCGLSNEQVIEDAYPCTQLQEGLIALAVKQPGSYIANYIFRLPKNVDKQRFKSAWEQTVYVCSNLRTRIVLLEGSTVQLVIKDDIAWEATDRHSVESFMRTTREIKMGYGSRLCQYALIEDDSGDGSCHFVWTIHHAVFDGWTTRVIMQTLHQAYYNGNVLALPPYSGFIRYTIALDKEAAGDYWKAQLHEAKRATFPPSSTSSISSACLVKKTILLPRLTNKSITKATVLRAAWAIVLARYCDTNDVCFGTSISGRYAPVPGVEKIAGPAVATVPVRVQLDGQQSISNFLLAIQNQASDMVPFEQYGLQNITKVSDDARDACDFSSLLVVQPVQEMYSMDTVGDTILAPAHSKDNSIEEWMEGYFTYPLVIQGLMMDEAVDLHLIYDPTILTEDQLIGLCHQFDHVTQQLSTQSEQSLNNISLTGEWDIQQAIQQNSHKVDAIESCVHQLIEEQAKIRPDALAIDAWDHRFTYAQLDAAANRLAHYLVKTARVALEDLVHVCFEKSAWFFVSILAINKAGAAWVPLDPLHPVERQRQVIRQTASTLALVSPRNNEMCAGLVANVIEVTAVLDSQLNLNPEWSLQPPISSVSPRNIVYVLFTSGSTGTPKGLVMEHGSVCASQKAISERLALTPDVRILQFASFIFDLCIGEIIAPLISGACICVPSEHIRLNNLTGFIHDMDINWAFLTPSFAQTIKPGDVPSLELLLLAGEAVSRDVLDIWFGKVRLINGWGPAETCVFSTLHEWTSLTESPLTIGRPVGGSCWIVDPNDYRKLAPIGCIGEVMIQGPTLLREYLSNPDATTSTILPTLPDWAPRHSSSHWNRFFKSGDLCFYNPDGTIEFSSRKDTQVKIRGLRVELSEVEHHIRVSLNSLQHVAVDLLKTENGVNLVSYLCFNKEGDMLNNNNNSDSNNIGNSSEEIFLPLTTNIESQINDMVGYLNVTLPRYMIPTIFIPCKYMPLINSAKIDRNKLRRLTSMVDRKDLEGYSLRSRQKRPPATTMEFRMQKIWANILNIPEESIGRDDSFLRIGGDSISAIRLVSMARELGIIVTVKMIFDDARLSVVANAAVTVDVEEMTETKPFSLLVPGIDVDKVTSHLVQECGLNSGHSIQDAYPCTQLQEGLIALSVKQPGSYIANYVFRLPKHVEIARFKSAWERTVNICSNLRTRIVLLEGSSIQVLVKDDITWEPTRSQDIHSFMRAAGDRNMSYGSRLCRYALVENQNGEYYFVWTIHHAIFDGWTTRIVLQTLHQAYHNSAIPALQPYSEFVKYGMNLDLEAASQYWRMQLNGAKRATFPPANTYNSSSTRSRDSTRQLKHSITIPQPTGTSITTATILRAAWSIVLARYCDTDDVCFGTSISGRHAPVFGIERTAGLVVATVPIRVQIDNQQSVSKFLVEVQDQASEMIAYEQYGLQNISRVSEDAKSACDFSSLLVIQPVQQMYSTNENGDAILAPVSSEDEITEEWIDSYFTYPLVIQALVVDSQISLHLTYDSTSLAETQLRGLCQHFEHVAQQLATKTETPLHSVSLTSIWDIEQAIQYNGENLDVVESCVHELIEQQAKIQPNALAIDAWDNSFTYSQLDAAANRLANYLVDIAKVRSGDLVHVCFEKSAWFIVAILSINKAGAAWVPLDPAHPIERQRQVVQQTAATLALASPANVQMCATLVTTVVEVTMTLNEQLSHHPSYSLHPPTCHTSPETPAYVLFTSGSTGTPKGCVIEHRSVCTNQRAITRRLGLTKDVRLLQFSSYVFDFSIAEIIFTLISGACICVPSEYARLNTLKEFISDMHINWLYLTPSVAQTLKPEDVPSVELLLLGGEAVSHDVFHSWFGKVRLLNCWGPTETCVCSSIHEWLSADESPLTIGRPVGSSCWIVSPEDPSQLAPIGCVGEIAIQGPTLLREYLSNPDATEAATLINLPKWTPKLSSPQCNRFYKTGDLCFYNPDGTIEFYSRKDTQVKIRGLRVELSEVEHHIRASLEGLKQVAVDVFKTDSSLNLVSYLCFSEERKISKDLVIGNSDSIFLPLTPDLESQISIMIGYLNLTLPQYMIPTLFIPCRYMPLSNSAKLDRKSLRMSTSLLDQQQLERYSLVSSHKRPPETEMEMRMQKIWGEVLNLPRESIGRDDSFLHIGGDSISAIRLVGAARDVGILVAVKNILDDSRLSAVAAVATSTQNHIIVDAEPFSLLPEGIDVQTVASHLSNQRELALGHVIQDAYPCTQLQEGLIALSVKQPGSYIANYVFRIPKNVEIARFKSAWERTVDICSNLRTRIVLVNGRSIQVLIKNDTTWETTTGHNVQSFMSATQERHMLYGSRLCRYALIEGANGEHHFIWTVHHAVFDGWTTRLIIQTLYQAYHDAHISAMPPYSRFISYTIGLDNDAASKYWEAQLRDAKRASFPLSTASPVSSGQLVKKTILLPRLYNRSITKATVLRAAWAIVLARYCDTNDICFGTSISGRHASVPSIEKIPGPSVATVPIRLRLNGQQSVSSFLLDVQNQASDMVPYEQYGLQNIAKVSADARDACDFSSLLLVQPVQEMYAVDDIGEAILAPVGSEEGATEEWIEGYFTYPLVIQALIMDSKVDLHLTYDPNVLTEAQLIALCHHFDNVTQQLTAENETQLNAISLASQWDLNQAIKWNGSDPEIVESCVHELIEKQVSLRPNALAIDAWDCRFTYYELDKAANRLAHYLIDAFGVCIEDLVHVCFEKSAWFIVAILAINKTGAAWVPLDPSHPIERHRQVVQQTGAKIALVSTENFEICTSLVTHVIEVTPELDTKLSQNSKYNTYLCIRDISPRNASYVLFTSGSTGIPKGFVMEHGSLCTSQKAMSERLGLTPDVRMLQFAAFVFDLCIGEIFATLISGACVCVPSEHTRLNNLNSFIQEMNINWAILTPSFARTLDPDAVPSLKALVLGGEVIGRDVSNMWFGKVRLISGWGPAETCVFNTLHEWTSAVESPLTIGRPFGAFCWIVDPEDHQRLAPIGCIGEVVIQGPPLLREYLANPKATQAALLNTVPEWTPQRSSPHWNRLYKTGDLCYYNPDGTIQFSSRKDTQVKIRGLRVELSDVEHHLQASLPSIRQVAVDLFKTENGADLVSYLCFNPESQNPENVDISARDTGIFLPITAELESQISAMIGHMNVTVPQYMIPTLFIPCRYMPLNNSAKLDRNMLRTLTSLLGQEELERYSLVSSQKRAPETEMEFRMQQIWSEVLSLPLESIGRDDSFLRLGGDSISAIRLVGLARDSGIAVAVKNIFDDPRLSSVASAANTTTDSGLVETKLFSLLPPGIGVDTVTSHVSSQCELLAGQVVQDAYPCTKLQEGLMALTVRQPRSHIASNVFRLPEHIDVQRFEAAWGRTVDICSNLRTRIILLEGSSIQVLINDDISWENTDGHNVESLIKTARETKMTYGSRLCRYALIKSTHNVHHFIWTIHHAVFDGWTMRIVLQTLYQAYHSLDILPLPSYNGFVRYTIDVDKEAAKKYWRDQLNDAKRATFPLSSPANVSSGHLVKKTIPFTQLANSSITKATVLRAAWAIILASYCDTSDVCFGTSISGRHAPVPGVEKMAGLAVATVPIRVQLDSLQSVSDFLLDIQNQASDMVAYEQYGLQNISKVSADAKDACDFSSLLVVQPVQQMYSMDESGAILAPVSPEDNTVEQLMEGYFTYPLVIQALIMDDQVELHLTYDSAVLTEAQLIGLCHQFDHVTQQLLMEPKTLLHAISMTSQWDLEQAIRYNSEDPEIVDSCVHQVIENQARLRPNAVAIDAWDHKFTYSQLDAAANRLAHHLVTALGVQTDDLVHVCFEKSAWFIVSIVAVNKAGAAWVPLDPSHPIDRQRQVVQQTAATLALSSPANAERCAALVENVIEVTPILDAQLSLNHPTSSLNPPSCGVSPQNAAYALFTSGSTGTPKGFVLEHRAVCTSQKAITSRMRLTPDVRLLQFSSYVFDFCIAEIIFSLMAGACICVPSDETRLNNLKEFISDMNINWLFLTPSVARTLSPDDLPKVELLFLAGEAVGRDVFDSWFGRARLLNGWGPAETCVCSTLHEWTSASESSLLIGQPVGSSCWIVDPEDPQRLAPIGCIGEVVIQGPTLLREYLSNPRATQETTLTKLPEWMPRRSASHWNRSYKTGDLCFYNPDGTIQFSSRKDTQVKIRGLRVELSEVEHHIRASLEGLQQVAVDKFQTDGGLNLVSYLCFTDEKEISNQTDHDSGSEGMFLPLTADLESQINAMIGHLNVTLPRYMIPTLFIPCRYMPLINSAKLDRNKLRAMTSKLDRTALERYSLLNSQKRAPETAMEMKLRDIWAEVLNIAADGIGRDDSFLRLGGDSITAIQLVTLARQNGIWLTVAMISDDPRLSQLAATAVAANSGVTSGPDQGKHWTVDGLGS
jgi:amino acid adenylation domain-containing protein